MAEKGIEPKRHGTPAERAAHNLVYYFSLMANNELRPNGLSDDCKAEIVGIVEDIIEAAVEKAVEKAVRKFVSIENTMDQIGTFLE